MCKYCQLILINVCYSDFKLNEIVLKGFQNAWDIALRLSNIFILRLQSIIIGLIDYNIKIYILFNSYLHTY